MSDANQPTAAGEQQEDLGFPLPPPATSSRLVVLIVAAVIVTGGFAFGYYRHKKGKDDVPSTEKAGVKTALIEVIKPKILTSDRALALPGAVRALEEVKLYPRVSGYVRKWLVDLGDKVTEGKVLAEIETPDVDAQLGQARAQLAQARAAVKQIVAQRDYSKANAARFESMGAQKLVAMGAVQQAQSQAANDEAGVVAAQANVAAQEQNVKRLTDQQGFAKVVAPFAGTITTRTIERGALVTEGNTTPMFTIDATDPIRVFIDVPQNVAPSVREGTEATITSREYAGRKFTGKVTHAAGALDPDLHTMVTEVQVPNKDGALFPGMYVQAELNLAIPHRVFEIPATALYNDANGIRVATVDANSKIHYLKITMERDTGATIQVASELTGDERIVKVAIPSLAEGDVVDVAK
jgi:RND family efflux transporter MFP subunit